MLKWPVHTFMLAQSLFSVFKLCKNELLLSTFLRYGWNWYKIENFSGEGSLGCLWEHDAQLPRSADGPAAHLGHRRICHRSRKCSHRRQGRSHGLHRRCWVCHHRTLQRSGDLLRTCCLPSHPTIKKILKLSSNHLWKFFLFVQVCLLKHKNRSTKLTKKYFLFQDFKSYQVVCDD